MLQLEDRIPENVLLKSLNGYFPDEVVGKYVSTLELKDVEQHTILDRGIKKVINLYFDKCFISVNVIPTQGGFSLVFDSVGSYDQEVERFLELFNKEYNHDAIIRHVKEGL